MEGYNDEEPNMGIQSVCPYAPCLGAPEFPDCNYRDSAHQLKVVETEGQFSKYEAEPRKSA